MDLFPNPGAGDGKLWEFVGGKVISLGSGGVSGFGIPKISSGRRIPRQVFWERVQVCSGWAWIFLLGIPSRAPAFPKPPHPTKHQLEMGMDCEQQSRNS